MFFGVLYVPSWLISVTLGGNEVSRTALGSRPQQLLYEEEVD